MKITLLRHPTLSHVDLSQLPFSPKLAADFLLWLAAAPLAFLLRYDGAVPEGMWPVIALVTAALVALKSLAAHYFHLHRRSWSKLSFTDLGSLVFAMGGVAIIASMALFFFGPALGVPRTIGILDGIITLALMAAVRTSSRYWYERQLLNGHKPPRGKNVLVVGAGEAGTLLVRELLRHPEVGLRPVGFVDDNSNKLGEHIAGVPVVGQVKDLRRVLTEHRVDEVLIAIPSAEGEQIRNIINCINRTQTGVKYRIIPGVYELLSGKVGISRMRDVRIDDLLRRPPVKLDTEAILSYIEGKTVMITGAGGSIGAELVRQICAFRPRELILYGHGENSIYQLERELDANWPNIKYHSVIGAVQIAARLEYVFQTYKPQVIFHSAAHKHVPLMELNPEEAVFNNIIASRNLVRLAQKYTVSHFVNISTDKAVNPSSIMGASKRMVEYIVQDAASRAKENQVFVSVRFGNVLGSRGSVIPIFKQQIEMGGPVTVTHPDMTRYFMTIPEAAQLVLQASGQGTNGKIYILDMGQPVRIVDLARDLISLSGYRPDTDIAIEYTGTRPGEKLTEELMTAEEQGAATAHENIFVAGNSLLDRDFLESAIGDLQAAAMHSDHMEIRRLLERTIHGCTLDHGHPPRSEQLGNGRFAKDRVIRA